MLSQLAGLMGLILLGCTAVLGATALRVRSAAELVLAAWVLAYGVVVALVLVLSVSDTLARGVLIPGLAALAAGALGTWLLAGAPRPALLPRVDVAALRGSGPVLVLAIVVVLAVAYALALTIGTPPNGWDQLTYHLTRAALWVGRDAVGYVDSAYDERINSYPPNGEIGLAFSLVLARNEVVAGIVQLLAALACSVGVFALARRLGLGRREASFGALLFLTLPIVLLQATSTKNDIVVASLLGAAAVFVLGESRREIAVGALAVALAVGTKFTAFYGVVLLLALALAQPRPGRRERLLGIALGTLGGLYWYAVNLVETGDPLGDTSGIPGLLAPLSPRENVVEALGVTVDWIDLSGAEGADLLAYPVVGLFVAAALAVTASRSGGAGLLRHAGIAAALVASPLLLYMATTELGRPALVELHSFLGEPDAYIPPVADPYASPTLASDTGSWFGPVGLLLATGAGMAAVWLVRRRALPRLALICAAAPLAGSILLALSLTYHPWQGRFLLFPVVLSASLWGLALRAPPVAWAAVATSAVTATLTFAHYHEKPSGLALFDRDDVGSVWSLDRSEVQSQHDPAIGPIYRYFDEEVGSADSVALALGGNDYGFPVFGPHLERRVLLVPFGSPATDLAADWLLASPDRAEDIDRVCWEETFSAEGGGTVFRRLAGCPM